MTHHDDCTQNKNNVEGQPVNEPEDDHADADRPDGLQTNEAIMDVKTESKIKNNDLDKYEPQSPCDQELTQLFFVFSETLKIPGGSCEKNEDRRTEMGDPSCEVKNRCCSSKVQWVAGHAPFMKKVPGMIERHNDHYQSTKQID